MYECTICGKTKESVNNPEYDFRRPSTSPEERTVVGSSDYCSKCQQLSFFVNLEDSDDENNDEKNAPDWVHQGFKQTVEGTSTCDSQHAYPSRPPEVPVLQKRHYMRQKKAPLTTPTRCEKQQHPELAKKTSLTDLAQGKQLARTESGTTRKRIDQSNSPTLEQLQRKIKRKRKLMKKLLKIQQLMVHLGWQSRMEWRRKKRQPVGGLHVLHQKRKKAEGDVDVDVDAGKGITSRCTQQQKGHKLEADLPKSIVQRCNYELSFPNPCLATGMPAWPAKSQFRTVLNDQDIQQALKEMLQKVAHSLQKAKKNPDPDSQGPVFVSGILNHMLKYYSALPIDRMRLRQSMTFFLDPNEMRRNHAKCQQTVGVQRKGDQLQQLIAVGPRRTGSSLGQGDQKDEDSKEMLLLWLTTLNPTDKRIFGTLAVRATDRPDSIMMATARTYDCLDLGALFDVLERPPKKRNELIAIQIQFH